MADSATESIRKQRAKHLSFNSLQVVLSLGMVAVGGSVSSTREEFLDSFKSGYFYLHNVFLIFKPLLITLVLQ